MKLAGLMGYARKGLGHREDQGFLIVAHDPPQAIAQVLDGLEQAGGYGAVIGREQSRGVEHQAKLQLAHDVQRGIALLGLEGVKRHKETLATERGRACCQPEMIGRAKQDEKHANQVQNFALGDREAAFLGKRFMNLCDGPALPKSPVPDLHDDFQRKAAAAHGQALRVLRRIDSLRLSTLWIGTPVRHINHPFTTVQKDDMFLPQLMAALQNVPTVRARGLVWPIVTCGDLAIIFSSSHSYPPLARNSSE
jgi:hypothetical protein